MTILNLTQHTATQEQIAVGVTAHPSLEVKTMLNFEEIPSMNELLDRAIRISQIALMELHGVETPKAMIGGAPFFMAHLEYALRAVGITPLYAFSQRVSEEVVNEDGSVTKVNKFKHLGFVGE